MTELATHDRAPPKPKRGSGAARPVLVSASALATHLSCVRSYVKKLVDQGVIERRDNGTFDQDQCRSKYIAHLRAERQRSPRSAADAEHAAAKAALLRLRVTEMQKRLMRSMKRSPTWMNWSACS